MVPRRKLPGFSAAAIPVFLALSVSGSPAQAQLIQGTLLDREAGVPVQEASVTLLKNDEAVANTLTDSIGFFSVPVPEAGNYTLEASRMGYALSRSYPIQIREADTLTVEVYIHPEAILLEPLVVTGKSSYGRASFLTHKEDWGKGLFFTPEMVDSINPRHPADVLWKADKTFLIWGFGSRRPIPRIRTLLGSGCLAYMVNRHVIDPRFYGGLWEGSPLEFLKGSDVVAVEYYRHISEVPPDLKVFADVNDTMCGLVIFWTGVGW